jgi:hypothetical protein
MLASVRFARALNDNEDQLKQQIMSTLRSTPVDSLVIQQPQIIQECCALFLSSSCSSKALAFGFNVLIQLLERVPEKKLFSRALAQNRGFAASLVQGAIRCYPEREAFSCACTFFASAMYSKEWVVAFVEEHILVEKLFKVVYGMPVSRGDQTYPHYNESPSSLACIELIASISGGNASKTSMGRMTMYMFGCFSRHLLSVCAPCDEVFILPLSDILRIGMASASSHTHLEHLNESIIPALIAFASYPRERVTSIAQYVVVLSLLKHARGDEMERVALSMVTKAALDYTRERKIEKESARLIVGIAIDLALHFSLDVDALFVVTMCSELRLAVEDTECVESYRDFLCILMELLCDGRANHIWMENCSMLFPVLGDVVHHSCVVPACVGCFQLFLSLVLHVLGHDECWNVEAHALGIRALDNGDACGFTSISSFAENLTVTGLSPSTCAPVAEAVLVVAAVALRSANISRRDLMVHLNRIIFCRCATSASYPTPVFIELLLQHIFDAKFSIEDASTFATPCRDAIVENSARPGAFHSYPIIITVCIINGHTDILEATLVELCEVYLLQLSVLCHRNILSVPIVCGILEVLLSWSHKCSDVSVVRMCLDLVMGLLDAMGGQLIETDHTSQQRIVCLTRSALEHYSLALATAKGSYFLLVPVETVDKLRNITTLLLHLCSDPAVHLEALVLDRQQMEVAPCHLETLSILVLVGHRCLLNTNDDRWKDVTLSWLGLCENTIKRRGEDGCLQHSIILVQNLLLRTRVQGWLTNLVESMIVTEVESPLLSLTPCSTSLCLLAAAILQEKFSNHFALRDNLSSQLLLRSQEHLALSHEAGELSYSHPTYVSTIIYQSTCTQRNGWSDLCCLAGTNPSATAIRVSPAVDTPSSRVVLTLIDAAIEQLRLPSRFSH